RVRGGQPQRGADGVVTPRRNLHVPYLPTYTRTDHEPSTPTGAGHGTRRVTACRSWTQGHGRHTDREPCAGRGLLSDPAQQALLHGGGDVAPVAGEHPAGGEPAGPGGGRAPAVVEEPLVGPRRPVEPQRVVQTRADHPAGPPHLAVHREHRV